MTRDDMIDYLKKIDLRAIPTVITDDMGLQYDYVTAEGAGTSFGGMGRWPVHLFNPIEPEKWNLIRSAIQNSSLSEEHLKDTDLAAFVAGISSFEPLILSEVLEGLLTLPEALTQPFFCFYDQGSWYARYDNPRFFLTEQEVKKAFIKEYVFDITSWEDMDDDELKRWFDRVQDEMDGFPRYLYDEDEQNS